jgi:hypothetical protein
MSGGLGYLMSLLNKGCGGGKSSNPKQTSSKDFFSSFGLKNFIVKSRET